MRLLVLGGTAWLGGAVATSALAQGHEVACLARGVSGSVPHGALFVPADRWQPGAYDGLGTFDAVVEVSWQPIHVASALDGVQAPHWVYVSSGSVYGDNGEVQRAWTGSGEVGREMYGEAKVACEELVTSRAGSCTVARAGLIGGYGDRSDRLGYWPARMAAAVGSRIRVLVPSPTSASVQVIDVEDLAEWLVSCARERLRNR
jgi:2'-hydroxyisoflavone reductase